MWIGVEFVYYALDLLLIASKWIELNWRNGQKGSNKAKDEKLYVIREESNLSIDTEVVKS